eukprot:snap_masked-scaffold324_size206069-processed-gene-1.0 protein:Tk12290 transcript:snap_masked-scaffold324_size206069-processed-gene-1.0-mRNA-1 annotation:"diguanylate cyclase"
MAPTGPESVILRSIFRNGTLGTYGEVAVVNGSDIQHSQLELSMDSLANNLTRLASNLAGDEDYPNIEDQCQNSTLVKISPTNLADIPVKEVF